MPWKVKFDIAPFFFNIRSECFETDLKLFISYLDPDPTYHVIMDPEPTFQSVLDPDPDTIRIFFVKFSQYFLF